MHAMRKLIILLSALVYVIHAQAQFSVTAHQEGWDNIPPQVQKPGFSFQQSVFANMDGDDALEEVMLFGRDNGHYPTFDLFKAYYAIVDNYTKEVQYISDEIYVTDIRKDGTIFLHKYKNRDFPFSNPYLPIWTGTMPLKK